MENIVILGSTGSIGRQTLEVLEKNPGYFRVYGLAAKNELEILIPQIKKFKPKAVSLAEVEAAQKLKKLFPKLKIYTGQKGLVEISVSPKVSSVLFATSGIVCLEALVECIKNKKRVLVANKESIIAAGKIIQKYLKKYKAEFIPLDSEHSAIFQCLKGENKKEIKNLILTCSGGPFWKTKKEKLKKVTKKEVLSHPVWKMGPKITVDSATLMNKGFEILEAHYIFEIPVEKIKVLIHPQCIIHSMVEFVDGSLKALLSLPDMKIPIQYALFHPHRLPGFLKPLNLSEIKNLSFFDPDEKKFPCLKLAKLAGKIEESMPAVLVFADEILVEKFLRGEIGFLDIPKFLAQIFKMHTLQKISKIEDVFKVKKWVEKTMEKFF